MTAAWIVGGLGAACWLGAWIALWQVPSVITFHPVEPWPVRARDALIRWMQQRWSAQVLAEMAVLGWSPALVAVFVAAFAALAGLPVLAVTHRVIVALIAGLLAGWFGPQLWVHRNFVGWQQELARDFVPLILLLSVYFDLGLSPERAVEEVLPAMGPATAAQLRILLTQWHQQIDTPGRILRAWAARIKLMPYQQLADVLAHHLDRGMSGEALRPLRTLVSAEQQQGARALADRVDQQVTVVPAVALLGLMMIIIYTFFAHGLGGGAGVTVL